MATLFALVMLCGLAVGAARGQGESPGSLASQPIVEGRRIFEKKGCARCHGVWTTPSEHEIGPNLGRIVASWRDVMRFAGALWNHLPEMDESMRTQHVERATFSPEEMGKLNAYLFYVKFLGESGDAERGRELFEQRLCARCHQVRGRGGTVGPRLDELKDHVSSFFLAWTLWNHGPGMASKMAELDLDQPRLQGRDVAHIVAFIRGDTKAPTVLEMAYAQAGTPRVGEGLFESKGCSKCHAVGGKGAGIGPDLGRQRQDLDISELAAMLWNHGAPMRAKMKELGVPFPTLTEREMSGLFAYLAYLQYVGPPGDAVRGGELFREKSCSGCHAVAGGGEGGGARPVADIAQTGALRSATHWAAAMWNHAPAMEREMREEKRPWPRFEGDEMRDVVEFLRSSSRSK